MAAASARPSKLQRLIPRAIESRANQLRRDLRMVLADFRGDRQPAWQARDGARYEVDNGASSEPASSPVAVDARARVVPASAAPASTETHALRVILDGETHSLEVAPGERLLEASLAAGLDMAHSCTLGGCGACMVWLERGEVDLDEPNCLSPEERAAGKILICVARPRGACQIRALEDTP